MTIDPSVRRRTSRRHFVAAAGAGMAALGVTRAGALAQGALATPGAGGTRFVGSAMGDVEVPASPNGWWCSTGRCSTPVSHWESRQ